MIAVDTSAIVAIAFAEPERAAFTQRIQQAGKALISSVSVVEARMVIHGRRGQRAVVLMDDLLRLPFFELAAPGSAEVEAAYAAFVTYGKDSGHPASLNFGDVFSYALAKVRNLPLLFKGDDFGHTDIVPAVSLAR
ncbi:MAG: PilT protein domain protein [Hydrocarboniphaga sp.]|uniref:type II toxin-antitoxin system VapC family toxin n=1 Tax=Hydrocarboniphaga sp. TaxID=2033016 RepID=UPI002625AF84|nr:type II toxin-antitoxin system VapC family toxin [Hydrocarboniphaga sp.]MDB5970959.1 PilT protein domain protein [Hydrocarboniphaga sp.]